MEFKNYQKGVLNDLRDYLDALNNTLDLNKAWEKYWGDKDFSVGNGGIPVYKNNIGGVPNICMKVPTGGGKTILACSSIGEIFHGIGYKNGNPRMVVWLVPSDSILAQTLGALSNPEHSYHQRLMQDNQGKVAVLNKEQLLSGQGFSLDIVREQLTICVMSFASLRIDSRKKDVRKVYQENGNLMSFKSILKDEDMLPDTPEDALIQTLRALHPVVVVDESHNVQSNLSTEMLENLNPSFILNLTATPRKDSNIISYVDARELQKENMVKLPVIVYNRQERRDVMNDALLLRSRLESAALAEEKESGSYIRPIVLFQAEPKIAKNKDTFEKIKEKLVERGIPKEQIAVKTSEVNDLAGIDLMSRACPIRYIITVNALKEGWDCPFAYILATLANKTSQVDVEQILGRVLRQPYTRQHEKKELNMSYVLTCSSDFHAILKNVVAGLNNAGFSEKDFRAVDTDSIIGTETGTDTQEQPSLFEEKELEQTLQQSDTADAGTAEENTVEPDNDDFGDITSDGFAMTVAETEASTTSLKIDSMLRQATEEAEVYITNAEMAERTGLATGELGEMQKQYKMVEEFAQEAMELKIPQFFVEVGTSNLFGESEEMLEPDNLSKGFKLQGQDTDINFQLSTGEIYEVNLAEKGEAVPKYKQLSQRDSQYFREYLATLPPAKRTEKCAESIAAIIAKRDDGTTDQEILAYVKRVVEGMTADEVAALETSIPVYADTINRKIKTLKKSYQEKQFFKWLDSDRIVCKAGYVLPKVIAPDKAISSIPKSLYEGEKEDMNNFELRLLDAMVSLDNVRWWHRIIDRNRNEMKLNGFINHYPDFMVMTTSGKLLLIEAKGDHLNNEESKEKLKLGRKWQENAGKKFKYFMVFDNKDTAVDGAYTIDRFIGEILKDM